MSPVSEARKKNPLYWTEDEDAKLRVWAASVALLIKGRTTSSALARATKLARAAAEEGTNWP